MPRLKSKCSINIWHSVSLPQVNNLGFGDLHVCSDADFVSFTDWFHHDEVLFNLIDGVVYVVSTIEGLCYEMICCS